MQSLWQCEVGQLSCRWSEVGRRDVYHSPWMDEALAVPSGYLPAVVLKGSFSGGAKGVRVRRVLLVIEFIVMANGVGQGVPFLFRLRNGHRLSHLLQQLLRGFAGFDGDAGAR